jgi:uncharacterized protein (DUF2062 family)
MKITGYRIEQGIFRELLSLGVNGGFLGSSFWNQLASQWGILFSFVVGSLVLSAILGFIAYPLSLKGVRYIRSHK